MVRSTYDVAGNGFGHVSLGGTEWFLVRRVSGPTSWHPANDDASGSTAYGSYSSDPLSDATFSLMYAQFSWDKILFASGDLTMWVTMARDVIDTLPSIQCDACELAILDSSEGGGSVQQYMRQGVTEDPWISAGHHPNSIVYGEGSYGGHNTDDALSFGGANVWVNCIDCVITG